MDYWERLFNSLMIFFLTSLYTLQIFYKAQVSLLHYFDRGVYIVPVFMFGYFYVVGELVEWIKENKCMMAVLPSTVSDEF